MLLRLAMGGAILWWAAESGAYPAHRLLRQERLMALVAADTVRLRREAEGLRAVLQTVEAHPELREQLARQLYGYVGADEVLYRFVRPGGRSIDGPDGPRGVPRHGGSVAWEDPALRQVERAVADLRHRLAPVAPTATAPVSASP